MRLVRSRTCSTASLGSVSTMTVESNEGACAGAATAGAGGADGRVSGGWGYAEGSDSGEFASVLAVPPRTTASTPSVAAATAAASTAIARPHRRGLDAVVLASLRDVVPTGCAVDEATAGVWTTVPRAVG